MQSAFFPGNLSECSYHRFTYFALFKEGGCNPPRWEHPYVSGMKERLSVRVLIFWLEVSGFRDDLVLVYPGVVCCLFKRLLVILGT